MYFQIGFFKVSVWCNCNALCRVPDPGHSQAWPVSLHLPFNKVCVLSLFSCLYKFCIVLYLAGWTEGSTHRATHRTIRTTWTAPTCSWPPPASRWQHACQPHHQTAQTCRFRSCSTISRFETRLSWMLSITGTELSFHWLNKSPSQERDILCFVSQLH